MRGLILGTLTAGLLWPVASQAEDATPNLMSQLDKSYGINANVFSNLRDDAWVAELSVPDRSRQIALAGVIRIKGSGENLVADLIQSRSAALAGPSQQQGFFTDPATVANLNDLILPEGDFEVLANCKPNKCKFKLSAESIQKVMSIDWKTDESNGEFTEYFRQYLADYVQKYREQGAAALIVYDDKPKPFPLRQGAESIRQQMTLLESLEPQLFAALSQYPKAPPEKVQNRFYWALKDFGYRPTLSVDQVILDSQPQIPGATAVVVFATIYADHYLAARYQTILLLDGEAALGMQGQYLLMVDRMLFDDGLGSIKRSLLGSGMKSDAQKRLEYAAQRAR
ncbi:MAG: hypothetical protein VCC04_05470 [Myxococcota bacterium]